MSSAALDSQLDLSRFWTGAARAAARLQLVEDEEAGSMQHFTTALLVGDLLARFHLLFVLSVLHRYDDAVARRISYALARSSGTGEWIAAAKECEQKLEAAELPQDVFQLCCWARSTPRKGVERDHFTAVADPLAHLVAGLQHADPELTGKQTPRSRLFSLLVEVRNKTVHGAYDSPFYLDHVALVSNAAQWLLRESPLWLAEMGVVTAQGRIRLLRGLAPTRSVSAPKPKPLTRGQVVFLVGEECLPASPLVVVRGANTFVANGSWRDSNASAEYLCHSLAASEPGAGTTRVELPELARPPLPTVGQVVDGQYEIQEILGEGEDAVVYLACHRDEDVQYVLKAFREPKEMFDQRRIEFAALQKINHPSIPRVQEIHRWESPFHLRFDHVPGTPLERCRASFAGNEAAVARLGISLADALAAVHQAGYVHRDIAPDNVLIPDDRDAPVRLVDFDMVAPIGTVGKAGTSLYRPPESDDGAPWVEASDLYSLSAVLLELLTGRLPQASAAPASSGEQAHGYPIVEPLQRCVLARVEARIPTAVEFRAALEESLASLAP